MKNFSRLARHALLAASVFAPLALAAPAAAQSDGNKADVYVGVQGGYHHLGDNPIGSNDGAIYGVYAGVDVPAGDTLILGIEGNFNLGTNAIDSEYGVAAKIGTRVGDKGQIYVRGGYQEVNFDVFKVSGGILTGGVDDTDGDYLLGVGGQVKLSDTMSLRAGVDTIAFDTVRATAGLAIHF